MDAAVWDLLRNDAAWARMPDPFVAEVLGAQPLAFLDATLTQELGELASGKAPIACLLDERGHVLAEVRVIVLREDHVLLTGEAASTGGVMGWLARVAPLSGCEVRDASSAWTRTCVRGPRARDAASDLAEVGDEDGSVVIADDAAVVRVRWGCDGVDVWSPRPVRLAATEIAPADIDAWSIVGGRPRFGVDVTAELILNETPLIDHAVSFTKGCYPGQETVAKIRNLGRARRAVAAVRARTAISPGTPLDNGSAAVGTVTSATETPEGAFGIAVVRAEALDAAGLLARGEPVELHRL